MLVEDKAKVLLPPTKERPLLCTLVCHVPDGKARLRGGVLKRNRGKALQRVAVGHKLGVAHRKKPANQKYYQPKHAEGPSAQYSPLWRAAAPGDVECRNNESANEPQNSAASFGKIQRQNLQSDSYAVER